MYPSLSVFHIQVVSYREFVLGDGGREGVSDRKNLLLTVFVTRVSPGFTGSPPTCSSHLGVISVYMGHAQQRDVIQVSVSGAWSTKLRV